MYDSFSFVATCANISSQLLQDIISNRPNDEDLSSLSIDDMRNGILASPEIHECYFDPRDIVVLKVRLLVFLSTCLIHARPQTLFWI